MSRLLCLASVMLCFVAAAGIEETRNGFLLTPSSLPANEVLAGGSPRDGIPALVGPPRLPAEQAPWAAEQWVVGVAIGIEAAAYPVAILEWHELVNDTLGGRPILVSYCALCGTAMVFDRRIDGRTRTFALR